MKFPAQPSSDEWCAALRAAGCEAGYHDYCHAEGFLPDGRRWDLGNPADDYGPDNEPLPPVLQLQVYESEAEEAVASPRWRRISDSGNVVGFLFDCTAEQAADAIVRANAGDYSAFTCDDGGPMPPLPPGRPLEGTLDGDGQPLFSAPVRLYLRAARDLLAYGQVQWPAGRCPRCGHPAGEDGVDLAPDGTAAHVTAGGVVALCAGSFTLDPVWPGTTYRPWAAHLWSPRNGSPAGNASQDRPPAAEGNQAEGTAQ